MLPERPASRQASPVLHTFHIKIKQQQNTILTYGIQTLGTDGEIFQK